MAYPERRRRRLRNSSGNDRTDNGNGSGHGTVGSSDAGPDISGTERTRAAIPPPQQPTGRRGPDSASPIEDRDGERGLRGLVGSGSSQVSTGAALRARDAARPTEADLAEAEERLVIIRRNWVPREDLPRAGR